MMLLIKYLCHSCLYYTQNLNHKKSEFSDSRMRHIREYQVFAISLISIYLHDMKNFISAPQTKIKKRV